MYSLNELEMMINHGDIQCGYNVNLNLQVLMIGEGTEYNVFYIQDGKLIKSLQCGFSSKLAYYSAKDLAAQFPHLSQEFLLYNK